MNGPLAFHQPYPGLRGQIARAPDGKDLNDVLMGAVNE